MRGKYKNVNFGDQIVNILLGLLLIYLLGGNSLSGLTDLISKIDFASFAPLLRLLGMDEKTVDFISSEEFSSAMGEGADLKKLLPLILSSGILTKKQPPENNSDGEKTVDENIALDPIKNVASTEIEENLGSFFS